jgi:YHS domain-containing protein
MTSRRSILAALGAVPLAFGLYRPAAAASPEIYAEEGIAIDGTDPVAYFNESRPVAGSPDHEVMWRGATWRFVSEANRTAFEADPEAYVPQFGGWCAWAVAEGYTASTVPEAWSIVDGRLYLNYSRGVQRRWERDIPGNIARGEANWPGVLR